MDKESNLTSFIFIFFYRRNKYDLQYCGSNRFFLKYFLTKRTIPKMAAKQIIGQINNKNVGFIIFNLKF